MTLTIQRAQHRVEVLRGSQWKSDGSLLRRLLETARPSYVDPTPVFERAVDHCDSLYLLRDSDEEVASYAMVAHDDADQPGPLFGLTYVGLTVSSERWKGSGSFVALYESIRKRLADIEGSPRVWLTTATPAIYLGVRKVWGEVMPLDDGSFSSEAATVADAVRKTYDAPRDPSAHPFVLRGVASGTRYSRLERERVIARTPRDGLGLLERLGIEERDGDRMIVLAGGFSPTRRES